MVRLSLFPILTLEPVFASDFLWVGLAADHGYLEARWRRPATGQELRRGVEAVTARIHEHAVGLLLTDLRAAGLLNAADQRWLSDHLASVHPATPVRRSARVLSAELPLQQVVDEVVSERAAPLPYESEVFHSETLALQWLFREEGP